MLPALPTAPTGKVDRQALLRIAGRQHEDGRGGHSQSLPDEPSAQSVIETAVCEEYAAVLGHAVDDREAEFFLLGGDSLTAMELVRRLCARFPVALSVRTFLPARNNFV